MLANSRADDGEEVDLEFLQSFGGEVDENGNWQMRVGPNWCVTDSVYLGCNSLGRLWYGGDGSASMLPNMNRGAFRKFVESLGIPLTEPTEVQS